MAAFRDDMPLVAGVNEYWDEDRTRAQIVRPDWDFSPIRMATMHHLPHIFFDTTRPERPDCPVLIPSSFSAACDRIISMDLYSQEPCNLPTGDFMPVERSQIRLMTASPITLRACIPAPDQVTPEQAYFKDLNFYKKTLFHTPVMPSGCHLRQVALPSANQLAVEDRPSASDYKEELSIDPTDMHMAVSTPVFQPYRGATGRACVAQEYGLTMDTSSLLSSGTEREDTDDEICSFDLVPEPMDPTGQSRIPSDEWLDDLQQGLKPGSSEPSQEYKLHYKVMPDRPSILDMMRSDMEEDETNTPQSPERALMPTMGMDYDYAMEDPPDVQRVREAPRHSTPQPELPTPNTRPRPASHLPRPRASSVPPSTNPAKRMAVRYHPITEQVTPPVTPPRAHAVEQKTVQDTPSPAQKPGRSWGRDTWRAPPKPTPGVGTRSRTRQAEIEQLENEQALAARAEWPPSPDTTKDIQRGFRELLLRDVPRAVHKELQHIVPDLPELDENQNLPKPPAGLMTQHQDIFFIPPPRVVGGARGISAPVSTATLGLIHRQNPLLAALLREDPGSMMSQFTRRRVYSTMRLIRTGMLGQLASLQQWEEAMHRQYDA